MYTIIINTNIKHSSKTVRITYNPTNFWFIQTWMKNRKRTWFKCPNLYLRMDAYIYNNMSAIRDKHGQKTDTKHSKKPIRKLCGHMYIHIVYNSVHTNRQTTFQCTIACVHTVFQTHYIRTWQHSQPFPKKFAAGKRLPGLAADGCWSCDTP